MKVRAALLRTGIYSVVGVSTEIVFSALHDVRRGKQVKLRTSGWMFVIYALITPLYEPLHRSLRERPAVERASIYGTGFLGVEYVTGAFFRSATGEAPWDYSYARHHVNGLIRPDYFFLWALAGLALERLHDRLT